MCADERRLRWGGKHSGSERQARCFSWVQGLLACTSPTLTLYPNSLARGAAQAIMLVEDAAGDAALLGRPRSLRGRGAVLTCLSGFIEQGEAIEEAVRREVAEEAGIPVGPVQILGSQPWPIGARPRARPGHVWWAACRARVQRLGPLLCAAHRTRLARAPAGAAGFEQRADQGGQLPCGVRPDPGPVQALTVRARVCTVTPVPISRPCLRLVGLATSHSVVCPYSCMGGVGLADAATGAARAQAAAAAASS